MNILKKTQNALAAWLAAQDLGDIPSDNVYKGIDNPIEEDNTTIRPTRDIPCAVCECARADAKEQFTGNYTCRASVTIIASADDLTDDEFGDMTDTVLNFLDTTSIASDLSAALANFTAFVVRIRTQSYEISGRTWRHTLELEIDCCGSDIS